MSNDGAHLTQRRSRQVGGQSWSHFEAWNQTPHWRLAVRPGCRQRYKGPHQGCCKETRVKGMVTVKVIHKKRIFQLREINLVDGRTSGKHRNMHNVIEK